MSEIKVTIVGNITKNPEIKTTANGKLVTRLRVGSTRKRHIDGQWVDGDRAYIDAECWDYLAQNVVNTFSKGDRIIAEGRLRTVEWKDEEGNTKSFTKVVADSIGPDLRFATAAITPNKTGASRGAEAERRAREAEEAEHGVGAEQVGRPNQTNHFDESVQREGAGGGTNAAHFFPNGEGSRPDMAGDDGGRVDEAPSASSSEPGDAYGTEPEMAEMVS